MPRRNDASGAAPGPGDSGKVIGGLERGLSTNRGAGSRGSGRRGRSLQFPPGQHRRLAPADVVAEALADRVVAVEDRRAAVELDLVRALGVDGTDDPRGRVELKVPLDVNHALPVGVQLQVAIAIEEPLAGDEVEAA